MVACEGLVFDHIDGEKSLLLEKEMKKIGNLFSLCDSSHEDFVVAKNGEEEGENGFFEIHHMIMSCDVKICSLKDMHVLVNVEQHEESYLDEVPNTKSEEM